MRYAARSFWWDVKALLGTAGQTLARLTPVTRELARFLHRCLYPPKKNRSAAESSGTYARGSVVTRGGIKLCLHESLTNESIERLVSGRHTSNERKLIAEFLSPEDIVLELGGGIGMVAIFIAQRIGSDRVFSFEGNPAMAPPVRENFVLNHVSPTMEFCMLDQFAGVQTFYICPQFNRSSTRRRTARDMACRVPVRPLNDELRKRRPTFLIMDIQVSEGGLLKYVDFSGLDKLLVEYHPGVLGVRRVNHLRRFVRRRGFIEAARRGNCIIYLRRVPPVPGGRCVANG